MYGFGFFSLWLGMDQMAAVAALCVQYEAEFRPNMSIVVKALQPLLNPPRSAPQTPQRNIPYWCHTSLYHYFICFWLNMICVNSWNILLISLIKVYLYIYTRNCTVLLPINGEHFLHVFRYKSVFSPVWTLKCSHSTYLHPRPLSLVSKVCNERKSMTFGLNFIQERRKQGQKDDNIHTLQSKNQDSNDYVKTKHRGTWNINNCKQMKKKKWINIQTKIFYFPMYSWFLKYNSFLDCAGGANPGMSLMSLLFGCTIWRPKNQELQQLSNE